LTGQHDITISGKSITGGSQPCINLVNCYSIHITNCKLQGSSASGVNISNCTDILVDNNVISNVKTGVHAENSPNGSIRVSQNQMQNMQGGPFIEYVSVKGDWNEIDNNKLENVAGSSTPANGISVCTSSGSSAHPLEVNGNSIRGGGASSTGILLGFNGGSYQVAQGNIIVNPGQTGAEIAGGSNIKLISNSIYSKSQSFSNVGIAVDPETAAISSATVSSNQVKYLSAQYGENDSYLAAGVTTPSGWSTNTWGASLSESILPTTLITGSSSSTSTSTSSSSSSAASSTGTTTTATASSSTTSSPVASLASLTFTNSSVINYTGQHDITISGKRIAGGNVPAITLTNCYNVHITQNYLGNSTTIGILLYNCKNITIDYNFVTNVSTGVYAEACPSGAIVVNYNQFRNMQGPFPRGAFVQFNAVSGAGNSISYNKGENIYGSSYPEDAINLFKSNGTSSSPIMVVGNWVRGGGPSATGGGIMLGDSGGSYQVAKDNVIVNPGQYGMAISGGTNMTVQNNKIYSKAQSFSNVGLYVWAQQGDASSIPYISNATVSGNQVHFLSGQWGENDSYLGSGETTPTGWSTNTWNASLTESILPTTILDL